MPSPVLVKSVLAIGATSGILGGAYLVKSHVFSSKESIKDRLEREGWKVLSHSGKDTEWTTIYGKYKVKEAKDASKLDENIVKDEADATGIPKLKKSCESALSKEFSESLYKSVIRWCVTPVSVEERLKYLGGYNKINIDESNVTDDNGTWQSKEVEFQKNREANNTYLGISVLASNNNQAENIKALKRGCKTYLEKKSYEDEFESSMKKVKDWCGK